MAKALDEMKLAAHLFLNSYEDADNLEDASNVFKLRLVESLNKTTQRELLRIADVLGLYF